MTRRNHILMIHRRSIGTPIGDRFGFPRERVRRRVHGRHSFSRMMVFMTAGDEVAADGQEIAVYAGGQDLASWHPPAAVPAGRRHGAEGVCVSGGEVVLVSPDGQGCSFPAGQPEAEESLEETLLREVREEACATVTQARLELASHPFAPIVRRALREAAQL